MSSYDIISCRWVFLLAFWVYCVPPVFGGGRQMRMSHLIYVFPLYFQWVEIVVHLTRVLSLSHHMLREMRECTETPFILISSQVQVL